MKAVSPALGGLKQRRSSQPTATAALVLWDKLLSEPLHRIQILSGHGRFSGHFMGHTQRTVLPQPRRWRQRRLIGAVVISGDQIHRNWFYIFGEEITKRTVKSKRKLNLELQRGKKTCLTSHFQLEASSIAMRKNMSHDRLVLPAVMTQTVVKRRLLAKKPPKKLFPSEILFNFSELSRCFSVC